MAKTLDMLVMQEVNDSGAPVKVTLGFGDIARSTTGIQKAVQQWMIKFLTVQGSVLSDTTFGTDFLVGIQASNLNNLELIKQQFSSAVNKIRAWDQANLAADTPSDELIISAKLISLNVVNKSTLQMEVQLQTADGTSRVYITPLPVGA